MPVVTVFSGHIFIMCVRRCRCLTCFSSSSSSPRSAPLFFLSQCYVVTASPARNPESKYQAWGHSSIVDPWGAVTATTGHESAMVLAEIDLGRVADIRKSIPVSLQKRNDLYRLELS